MLKEIFGHSYRRVNFCELDIEKMLSNAEARKAIRDAISLGEIGTQLVGLKFPDQADPNSQYYLVVNNIWAQRKRFEEENIDNQDYLSSFKRIMEYLRPEDIGNNLSDGIYNRLNCIKTVVQTQVV